MAVKDSTVGKCKGATSKKHRHQQAVCLIQFQKMIAHKKEEQGKQGTAQTDSTQGTEIGTDVNLFFDIAREKMF
jgi:hypothetical protein